MLEQIENKNVYEGDGVTTEFAFTFTIWEEDQIVVVTGDGDCRNETILTDYTVTITDSGGTVVLAEPPAKGLKVVLMRYMPYLQEDTYVNGARFDPAEIEDRFDQDCAERQDLVEAMNRAVKVCVTSTETPEELLASIYDARDKACECAEQSCECAETSCECAATAEAAMEAAEALAATLNYVGGAEFRRTLGKDYEAGSTLTIPNSGFYLYGTYHLRISVDGIVLSRTHYEEVGENRGDICKTVKFLMPLYSGQEICYWIVPLGEAGEILTEVRAEGAEALTNIETAETEALESITEATETFETAAAEATNTMEDLLSSTQTAASDAETCKDEACACASEAEETLEAVKSAVSMFEYSGGSEGTVTLTADYATGSTFTLPGSLFYYVGAYQLRISVDGIVLSHTHYTEVGTEGETSTQVTFLMPLYSGQEICYWVTPLGYADEDVKQEVTEDDAEYPILTCTTANNTETETSTARYAAGVTINPSTSTVTATAFVGDLTGTAAIATADASGNVIADTYATKTEVEDATEELTDAIDALETVAASHVKYDEAQELTSDQQAQARTNIDALGTTETAAAAESLASSFSVSISGDGTAEAVSTDGTSDVALVLDVTYADAAGSAVQDGDGNVIVDTYATKTEVEEATEAASAAQTTADAAVAAVSGVYIYKGSVDTEDDLPTSADVGDVYNVGEDGMNYAWTGTEWDALGGVQTTVETANKLGSSTVGGTAKPIYLSSGTATACSSTVGGTAKPVYLKSGTITACSSTVGDASTPVYMSSGTITACTGVATSDDLEAVSDASITGLSVSGTTVTYTYGDGTTGTITTANTDTKVTQTVTTTSANYPILACATASNTATATTTTRFGTGVTLNPSTSAITATSFVGDLTGDVTGNADTATTATKLGSSTVGGTAKPIYLSSGTATACSSTVGGTAKPVYLKSGTITACSSTVGDASTPVYMSSGTITACTSLSAYPTIEAASITSSKYIYAPSEGTTWLGFGTYTTTYSSGNDDSSSTTTYISGSYSAGATVVSTSNLSSTTIIFIRIA